MGNNEAVVITGERQTAIIEVPVPQLKSDQILIRVLGCAICTWEQRVFAGLAPSQKPFLGGHEIAGEIVSVGEDINPEDYPVGTKATVRLLNRCGCCPSCRTGMDNLCDSMDKPPFRKAQTIAGPGGMVQYMAVDAEQVYLFENDVPIERVVFSEPLGCVVNGVMKASVKLGDDVIVIGAGIMGILSTMCLKLQGARVIVSEPDAVRAKLAKKIGADIVIDPIHCDPVEQVRKITGGAGVQAVINTITPKVAVTQGIHMLAKGGTFVMYGIVMPNAPIDIDFNYIHYNETRIVGCMSPSVESFHRSVNLLNKGILKPEELGLLSASYDYKEAQKAYEDSILPSTYRVMVKM